MNEILNFPLARTYSSFSLSLSFSFIIIVLASETKEIFILQIFHSYLILPRHAIQLVNKFLHCWRFPSAPFSECLHYSWKVSRFFCRAIDTVTELLTHLWFVPQFLLHLIPPPHHPALFSLFSRLVLKIEISLEFHWITKFTKTVSTLIYSVNLLFMC